MAIGHRRSMMDQQRFLSQMTGAFCHPGIGPTLTAIPPDRSVILAAPMMRQIQFESTIGQWQGSNGLIDRGVAAPFLQTCFHLGKQAKIVPGSILPFRVRVPIYAFRDQRRRSFNLPEGGM